MTDMMWGWGFGLVVEDFLACMMSWVEEEGRREKGGEERKKKQEKEEDGEEKETMQRFAQHDLMAF